MMKMSLPCNVSMKQFLKYFLKIKLTKSEFDIKMSLPTKIAFHQLIKTIVSVLTFYMNIVPNSSEELTFIKKISLVAFYFH